jgi:hypothetical protein
MAEERVVKRSGFVARQGRQPSGLLGHVVGRIICIGFPHVVGGALPLR